ncbi:M48 family metalloprotease [Streptomyces afghaniensis]|uniref:M48 family metalloprotease n=1 Tax=Streptomyces afghaniensis TaxID=66865 RepID=UPI00379E0899
MSTPPSVTAAARARTGRYGLADTGPRFALLMTVVVASSVRMLDGVLAPDPDDTPGDPLGCLLAAGMDPDGRNLDNLLVTMRRPEALAECMAGVPTVEYWKGIAATAALLAVAALVYWWQPRLRERWRRTVPAESLDTDGSLGPELRALRELAGVTSGVRFRVDPTRTTSGAVVYGRFGEYTVCLHAGLLVRRATDPEGFRAVVLHELAHIRNRDVEYASASTALWRAFVVLALLPYLWHEGTLLVDGLTGRTASPFWPGVASMLTRSVLAGLLLVGLVHLARADLLRRRELYADARAVSSGAPASAWDHRDRDSAVATSVRRVTALLRTHPSWAERRRALAEPGRLSGVGPLAMLLVGASGTLLVNTAGDVVPRASTSEGGAWLTTAFLAPVLYVALARSVTAAQVSGRKESGLRSGLWLGCGLVLGELANGKHSTDWLGPEPGFLLGLLLTAAVAAAWSAQCTHLALGLARTWLRRAAGLLNLLVTAVLLWGGLYWWYAVGWYQAMGVYSQAEEYRDMVRQLSPGSWEAFSRELSAITQAMPTLTTLNAGVLLLVAAPVLWIFPLVLRVSTSAASGLRRTLGAGVAGGLLCWVLLFAVNLFQRHRRPATWAERTGPYLFVHRWLLIAAVLAACLLTAAAVAALSRHLWLPRALAAVAVTQLFGYAAIFVMFSADGCLGPFSAFVDRCAWVPPAGWPFARRIALNALTPAVLLAACAAVGGAGVRGVVGRLVRLRRRQPEQAAGPGADGVTPGAPMTADGVTPSTPATADGSAPHAPVTANRVALGSPVTASRAAPHAPEAADRAAPGAQVTTGRSAPSASTPTDDTTPHAPVANPSTPDTHVPADKATPSASATADGTTPHAPAAADPDTPDTQVTPDKGAPHGPVVAPVSRWRRLAPAGAVVALVVPTLLLTAAAHSAPAKSSSAEKVGAAGVPGDTVTDLVEAAPRARSARIRAWQALAWLAHGGLDHFAAINRSAGRFSEALLAAMEKPGPNGEARVEKTEFHRICGTLVRRTEDAMAYFPVPDQRIQKKWSETLTALSHHASTCRDATAPGDETYQTDAERSQAFTKSVEGVQNTTEALGELLTEVEKVALPANKRGDT